MSAFFIPLLALYVTGPAPDFNQKASMLWANTSATGTKSPVVFEMIHILPPSLQYIFSLHLGYIPDHLTLLLRVPTAPALIWAGGSRWSASTSGAYGHLLGDQHLLKPKLGPFASRAATTLGLLVAFHSGACRHGSQHLYTGQTWLCPARVKAWATEKSQPQKNGL